MDVDDQTDNSAVGPPRPRTLTVMGLLVTAAGVLSYLLSYAGADALRAAEVFHPWPPEHDPRPRWLVWCFMSLLGAFLLMGGLVRYLSHRQLRRIDRIADEEAAG